jgi:hypothetical protein
MSIFQFCHNFLQLLVIDAVKEYWLKRNLELKERERAQV